MSNHKENKNLTTDKNLIENKYLTMTAKMYQWGYTKEQAIYSGGDALEFQALDDEFSGGSIPLHLILGVEYRAPYACEYHTGGKLSKMLRDGVQAYNENKNNKAKKPLSWLLIKKPLGGFY